MSCKILLIMSSAVSVVAEAIAGYLAEPMKALALYGLESPLRSRSRHSLAEARCRCRKAKGRSNPNLARFFFYDNI